ncbi:MAG: BlaI/MecI/CopY family transcriptional regulator [Planctomycetes bacterium]|nr:BlaI/MecI/CopY family transcriptional regulator [Planctomycetota bacterium]
MARPKARQLTERELEIMHVFWRPAKQQTGSAVELTAAEVRQRLADKGRDLAYTTVATLIKILVDKGFIRQTTDQRPFGYQAQRSFKDVSARLVNDLVDQVFSGSRETLLLRLVESKKLTKKERQLLEQVLREKRS